MHDPDLGGPRSIRPDNAACQVCITFDDNVISTDNPENSIILDNFEVLFCRVYKRLDDGLIIIRYAISNSAILF